MAAEQPRADVAQQRALCTRQYAHVRETLYALGRSDDELAARIDATLIAREKIHMALEAREQSDVERDRLAAWLTAQRTKFLMSTRVDMLITLHERLLSSVSGDHGLRRYAAQTAHELAGDVLRSFEVRVQAEVRRCVMASVRHLVAAVGATFAERGHDISLDHVAGAEMVPEREVSRPLAAPAPGIVASVVDRLGPIRRERIELAARETIIERCETGSRRIVVHALEDFDHLRTQCEDRFGELLDGVIASVRHAATFAARSRAAGPDQVIRDRVVLAQLMVAISQTHRRLQAGNEVS